jgi:membrane dipeptidase
MMIDLSHSGEKTFWDVLQTTTKPVIASHSCVYALAAHVRNLKDDQIIAISKNGGYIGINFYPGYLDVEFEKKYSRLRKSAAAHLDSLKTEFGQNYTGYRKYQEKYYQELCKDIRPDLALIIDHIEYVVNLVGDDYVGLGSDFDGITISHGLKMSVKCRNSPGSCWNAVSAGSVLTDSGGIYESQGSTAVIQSYIYPYRVSANGL